MQARARGGPERFCGTCSLCCILPDIDELEKPANDRCLHCRPEGGCAIYEARPSVCRSFFCSWMSKPSIGPEWEPARCHMMVYDQGRQITVLVDAQHPDVWRREPHFGQLQRWASDAAEEGGFVIVFVGEEVIKIDVPSGGIVEKPSAARSAG